MAKLACFAVTLLLIVGCGIHSPDVVVPAASPPACDALETRLRLTASSPERIDLEWSIRNRGEGRVWIADSWGLNSGIELQMPQPFIAPPADLMYLFARPFQTRTNQLLEGTAHWAQRSIAPGETVTGRLQLELPFRVQRHLTSPYEVPLGTEFLNETPKDSRRCARYNLPCSTG